MSSPLSGFIFKLFMWEFLCNFFDYILVKFQQFYGKFRWFLFIHTKMAEKHNETDCTKICSEDVYCEACSGNEGALTEDDVNIVFTKLEMSTSTYAYFNGKEEYNGKLCRRCRILEDTSSLLEEEDATMGELEETFRVFDKNREGFVDARKLQVIMCKLEFKEGEQLDDCARMISVFDTNGDGKIDLFEFRKMFETDE
ncbi:hypothetical protein MKX01_003512 [Papaver californicum]|nr:hypothetical protein MKX01_003512 [Papaver californicum]